MAKQCFCGCGENVKLTRRALSATGRLVGDQLAEWDAKRSSAEAVAASGQLDPFLRDGQTMYDDLREIVHGGPVYLTFSQKEITRWLASSRQMLVDEKRTAAEPTAQGHRAQGEAPKRSVDAEARARRRAEIVAIRKEYEQGD